MTETYTRDEFIRSMTLRFSISEKTAGKYADEHPKESYTEDDLADAWRAFNPEQVGGIIYGLTTDGQNKFSMANDTSCYPVLQKWPKWK